jgi:hypothetical protein
MSQSALTDEDSDYDSASRFLVRTTQAVLTPYLLGEPADQVQHARWADTRRLSRPPGLRRTNDLVLTYTLAREHGKPRAALFEVELKPQHQLAGRLLTYTGLILNDLRPATTAGDEFAVLPVVIALTGRSLATRDLRNEAGQGVLLRPLEWNLATLDAGQILADVPAQRAPWPLLAWVPLMQGGTDERLGPLFLQSVLALASSAQSIVKDTVVVFADAVERAEFFRELLKEVHVIRSPYAEELRNEGRAEGRTEGRLSSLLLMVKTKFGASPRNLKAQLLKITQERDWDELFVAAVTAVSIAEFSAVVAAKVG